MKVFLDRPELDGILGTTLADWNRAVAGTVAVLMDMRAGRLGPTGEAMWTFCEMNVQSDPLAWLTRSLPDPPKKSSVKFTRTQDYRAEHAGADAHDQDGVHRGLGATSPRLRAH